MLNFLGILSDLLLKVGNIIRQTIRSYLGGFAALIYNFIADEYNIFVEISRANIIDSDIVQQIYNRVGIILGLFMVFKLSFSLIQHLIDPSKFSDNNKGYIAIIRRLIIAIVLLGTTPTIFKEAFSLQDAIVGSGEKTNIIYKLIVADKSYGTSSDFGRRIATDLFFSFYRESYADSYRGDDVAYFTVEKSSSGEDMPPNGYVVFEIEDFDTLKEEIYEGYEDFNYAIGFLSTVDSSGRYIIQWDGLFSIVVGVFMVYILLTYCIQAAARVVQLAFLQLIAPIPILSYVNDPEGTFKAWVKQCITTYVDLFMRLAVIYFIILMCNRVIEYYETLQNKLIASGGSFNTTNNWVKIFIILGLLMFGKKVPDLIKEMFPNIGGGAASMGSIFKKPKDLLSSVPIAGAAVGYLGGKTLAAGKWGMKKIGTGAKKATGYGLKKAWGSTGGRLVNNIKDNRQNRKSDLEAQREQKRENRFVDNAWKNYGSSFKNKEYDKVFDNNDFTQTYRNLQEAKRKLKESHLDTNSAEYVTLQKDLDKAQKAHDIQRKLHGDLARRQDFLERHSIIHPAAISTSESENDTPNTEIQDRISNATSQNSSDQTLSNDIRTWQNGDDVGE